MKIAEIQIIPTKPNNGHIGFCSFVLNDAFHLSGIAIYTRFGGGYRLVYPTKYFGLKEQAIFYPIRKEIGQMIERKIVEIIEKVMNKNDRHHRFDV